MALKESFVLSDGTGWATYGTTWSFQTWTTTSAYTISGVALYGFKYGSPGNITVSIREVDGATGKPTGGDKCSVTVAEGVISAFPTRDWYTFTFDTSYVLDDATQYAIVIKAPTSGGSSDYYAPFGYGSSGYAGGGSGHGDGSIWGALSTTNDMDFRIYGEMTLFDSYTGDVGPGSYSIFGNQWITQMFTAIASYSVTSMQARLFRIGDPGNVTMVLRAVTGGVPVLPNLATSTIVGTTISDTSPGEYITFTLAAAATITKDSIYAWVISAPTGVDVTDFVSWRAKAATGYETGKSTTGGGDGTWTDYSDMACNFRNYGDGAVPVDKTYSRKLIAIGNGEVWQEKSADPMEMEEITTATGLDTSDVLNAAVASQKLFIVNGTIKKVLDFVNVKIVADTGAGVGARPPDFGTVLESDGAGTPTMIVDYITSVTAAAACTIYGKRTSVATFGAGETVTGTNPTTSDYAGDVSFVIGAADEVLPPHWYDYTVFGNDTDGNGYYGAMPTIAYEVCRYRGRIQLCRDPNYPHQWYQSRQLNPFDFLFAPGDAQSPVHGNQADCSEVGDIVVTAIPYSDDILVYGCANELWVMHGDAAFGGELNPLDKTTGILGDRAWCWDDKVNLYMMCTVGLLRIPKGFGQIENLTRELYPDFIEDLAFDASLHRITLAFDPENFGIHIFKTTLVTGACTVWWYDLRTEGLFPDAIPTAMGIYSAFYYQTESPLYRKLLVGCADGYIKSFDKNTNNDDGTIITSYVGFAPLALSTHPRKDGIIKNIDIVTGIGDADSDGVTCTVHVARTAAQIIKKLNDGDAAAFTKVFITPNWSKSNLDRRSIRGQWGAIVLTNAVDDESWSMERLIVDSKEIGRSL